MLGAVAVTLPLACVQTGALAGTQSWSLALSKRLRTPYKPAYGTRRQPPASGDGTAASTQVDKKDQ